MALNYIIHVHVVTFLLPSSLLVLLPSSLLPPPPSLPSSPFLSPRPLLLPPSLPLHSRDVLESILETCREVKEQLDGVLLKDEMETKQGDLKELNLLVPMGCASIVVCKSENEL